MPRVEVGSGASLLVHIVKKASAIQETQVQSLGWEDPLQYSYPENSMDRGTWRATVHGVAKSQR